MNDSVPQDAPLKQCSKCPNSYPATLDFFHRCRKGLRADCKECSKKRVKTHYTKHPEYYQEYAKTHAEQMSQHTRNYRIAHPEKVRQYASSSHEQRRVYEHNRRARISGIPGTHTLEDIQKQYERQKGRCYWCNSKLTTYHIDHVIPITREGSSNAPWNLVVACPKCNISKKDKLPHEWPAGGRLL